MDKKEPIQFECPICLDNHDEDCKTYCEQCKNSMCVYCLAKWKKSCPFCCKNFQNLPEQNDLENQLLPQQNVNRIKCFSIIRIIIIILVIMGLLSWWLGWLDSDKDEMVYGSLPSISASPSVL